MRTRIARFYCFALAALFIFCAGTLGAQSPDFPAIDTLTPETLFQATVEPLFGAMVILSGYLSAFIPGVKRLTPFLRVIAFAVTLGLGFHLFGGASIWKLALTYFFSTGLYLTTIKNLLPSPKAAASA